MAHTSLKRIRETGAFPFFLYYVCLGNLCAKEMNNQAISSNKINICKKINFKRHSLFGSCTTFGYTLGHCTKKNFLVILKGNSVQKLFLLFYLL